MNINHEHKVIWFAPQRCGTKALAHIFTKLGFEFYEDLNSYYKGEKTDYQSHHVQIPPEFSDYELIISTRNPYDRILSLYGNFTTLGSYVTYTKELHNNFMQKFEIFVGELFYKTNKNNNKPILNNYILRYSYLVDKPYKILRMENLVEDLSKIKFVKNSDLWKSGYIHDYISFNEHITKRPYTFNTIYTTKAAKMVYENQHKHFLLGGYDPFSFTKEQLSNIDKMRFLHENLE